MTADTLRTRRQQLISVSCHVGGRQVASAMANVPPAASPPSPSLRAVQPAILMKFLTNVYLAEVTMAMRAKRVLPSSTTPPPLFLPPLPFATPIPNSEGSCTARRVPQTQTRVPHNFLQNESINEAFRGQLRVVNRIATERVYRGSNLPQSLPHSLSRSLFSCTASAICSSVYFQSSVFGLQPLVFK